MLKINCPCMHVIAGTACVSKLASALVTCSVFSSPSHSIVHLSSLNCRQMFHPNEPGMYGSNLYLGGTFVSNYWPSSVQC